MIAVTGASGNLGSLVLEGLLKIVPPDQLVAIVRNPKKAERFASRGVHVRRGDYSAPETLAPALADVTRLLLVSGSELGKRVDQHLRGDRGGKSGRRRADRLHQRAACRYQHLADYR